jgi:hypothetical protein
MTYTVYEFYDVTYANSDRLEKAMEVRWERNFQSPSSSLPIASTLVFHVFRFDRYLSISMTKTNHVL